MEENSHELLVRYQRGDPSAAEAIFERYASRLLALARSRLAAKLARRIDADDVVQSTYRSFFVRAREGDVVAEHVGDLWRLLATMTLHKLGRQAHRHRAAKRSIDRESYDATDDADRLANLADGREPTPADVVATVEEAHWLLSQFDSLQRQAIELRLQEHSEAEIAATIGRSERTVRRWLAEARELLAARLTKQQRVADDRKPTPSPLAASYPAPLNHADYQLSRLIGAGGVSKVYLATHKPTLRRVAVKVLRKRLRSRPHLVERFLKEAEIVARFNHPNIVPIHGLGRFPDGGYFIVMDWIDGSDLHSICRQQRVSFQRAAEIVAIVADAIQHAHERGVIHRDIKPGNVLLGQDGRIFVTDFGFAWVDEETPRDDRSIVGTAGFMAPEQIDPDLGPIGPQTDVYGLGALLLMLSSGETIKSPVSSAGGEAQGAAANPTAAEIPDSLRQICERCLAANWRERYSTAAAVACALRSSVL